jgi:hypothetical protein
MVCPYGNIYHQDSNFPLALNLKEGNQIKPKYFDTYINLKDMANFPIGSIINSQKS